MAVSDIMEIGKQGLAANRTALQTTSHNIANANTPGYTRQRTELVASPRGTWFGGGVEAKQVLRVHDSFVHNQILDESRALGTFRGRSETLRQVEGVIAEHGTRVSEQMNRFFNDFRELSTNPELATLRSGVLSTADNMTQSFRQMSDSLSDLKTGIDIRIATMVQDVNQKTAELAQINGQIRLAEGRSESPNDLYDRRDTIVREISTKLGVQSVGDDSGHVNLTSGNLGVLVNGEEAAKLETFRTSDSRDLDGKMDIRVTMGGSQATITTKLTEGEIGGLLHVRDQVINPALNHLDQVAFGLAQQVNGAHVEGQGLDGEGERYLFDDIAEIHGAARLLKLDDNMKSSPDTLAVGMDGSVLGDNRVALKIADIQNMRLAPDVLGRVEGVGENRTTLNESLNSLVSNVGSKVRLEEENFQHQDFIVKQLENYRDSISGVSLEEEAVNMMRYQSVFNASAKAMKVGDELMETILSLRG